MRVHPSAAAVPVACLLAVVMAAALAACGMSGPSPSPTPRPELAWSRAAMALPADVVEMAPGSSGGMICSPCHAEQASLLLGVTTTSRGLLAVGVQQPPSSAVAYESVDGRSWTPSPGFEPGPDTAASAAASAGSRVVIAGSRGTSAGAWASAGDGSPWEAAPAGASLRPPAGGIAAMRGVVAWGEGFVAVGSLDGADGSRSAAVWTSPDGLEWTRVAADPAFAGAAASGIAASPTRLVVVGSTEEPGAGAGTGASAGAAWVSENGVTWTRVASPAVADGPMRAVAWTGTAFVAVGSSVADDRAAAWASPDGTTWATQPSSPALLNHGDAIRMAAVAGDGSGLVAAGWKSDAGNGSGVVWRSSDGRTWERVPDQVSMSGASLSGVAIANGAPVVVGTSGYPDNDQASAWYEGP